MIHLQLHQLINLIILVFIGKTVGFFHLSWLSIVAIILFIVMIEHLCVYYKDKQLTFFSYSSVTTAIGIMLMMVVTQWYIYVILIGVGLLQKHFMTVEGRHFFNPSNFALMMGLLFFYEQAHMVLGQLGDSLEVKIVVMLLAILILIRAQRWLISVAFVISYMVLQSMLVVAHDPVLIFEEVTNRFYSVAFIVFIVFMLTDPKTTPNRVGTQFVFALLLALFATLLDRYYGFRVQHLFMALFILSVFVPLINRWGDVKVSHRMLLQTGILFILALLAIIYIQIQPPYYLEMQG